MSPTISRTFDPRYLLEGVPKRDLSNLFSTFERLHSRKLMNETSTVKITRRPPRQCKESALNWGGLRAIVTMQTNIQPGSPRANGKENNQSGPNQIITPTVSWVFPFIKRFQQISHMNLLKSIANNDKSYLVVTTPGADLAEIAPEPGQLSRRHR